MEYTAGLRLLGIYSPYMAFSSSFVSSLVDLADNWKRQLTLEETETGQLLFQHQSWISSGIFYTFVLMHFYEWKTFSVSLAQPEKTQGRISILPPLSLYSGLKKRSLQIFS